MDIAMFSFGILMKVRMLSFQLSMEIVMVAAAAESTLMRTTMNIVYVIM
jgi:hypothetical protein